MAFSRAVGYENLPQGNFSPTIYSKKAQLAFRRKAVVQAISNTDYFGEIANYGDTVNVIKEPEIVVSDYVRGQKIDTQDLQDDQITLTVDQAKKFSFAVDDLERKQAHHNWEAMATSRGGFKLADAMDVNVLQYLADNILTANTIGTTSTPQDVQVTKTAGDFTPLSLMNRFKRLLNEADVPEENRWFVADPFFYEMLEDEDSKLLDADYAEKGILRNGRVATGMIRGFTVYSSNNLPSAGDGPSGTTNSDYGYVFAGHMSALATAEQITKTETIRSEFSFADIVRGLHVFGRKLLRDNALVGAVYHTV